MPPLAWLGLLVLAFAVKRVFDTPSRTYDPANPNVGDEYDAWTECALQAPAQAVQQE